jgi:hypothetical protein
MCHVSALRGASHIYHMQRRVVVKTCHSKKEREFLCWIWIRTIFGSRIVNYITKVVRDSFGAYLVHDNVDHLMEPEMCVSVCLCA